MTTDQELQEVFLSLKKDQIFYLFYKRTQGLENEAIADKLGIAHKTFQTHVHAIYVLFDIQVASGESDRMWQDLIRRIGQFIDTLNENIVENWRPTPRPVKAPAKPRSPTASSTGILSARPDFQSDQEDEGAAVVSSEEEPPLMSIASESRSEEQSASSSGQNSPFAIPRDPEQALRDLWHQHWREFLMLGILLVGSGYVVWNISHHLFVAPVPVSLSTPGSTRTPLGKTTPISSFPPLPTITSAATASPVPTASPTETLTPTSTLTSTDTPTPTASSTPSIRRLGDLLQDNRVSLRMINGWVPKQICVMSCASWIVGYRFEFQNNLSTPLLLIFDKWQFSAHDNLGKDYSCIIDDGYTGRFDSINKPLASEDKFQFEILCGENIKPIKGITNFTLKAGPISSLPPSVWGITVAQ